jgi:hypothetical protein
LTDFAFVGGVVLKISRGGQHAHEKKCGVDGRQFTVPDALSTNHVEKVVIETLIAGCIRVGALNALVKETEG